MKQGREKVKCILDSSPLMEILTLIASGKNYALAIAEARGKKDSSPTAKQLNQLKSMGLLLSKKLTEKNKTIYYLTPKGAVTLPFCDRIQKEKTAYDKIIGEI